MCCWIPGGKAGFDQQAKVMPEILRILLGMSSFATSFTQKIIPCLSDKQQYKIYRQADW